MTTARARRRPGQALAGVLMVLCILSSSLVHLLAQTGSPDPALAKLRSRAATQHEIVMLLIGKKDFAKAVSEAVKIFEMKWPADQEPLLLKELLFFSDQLRHKDQPGAGVELLDKGRGFFRNRESIVEIWKEKGFLYKQMRQEDQALECFREAQRLENAPPERQ